MREFLKNLIPCSVFVVCLTLIFGGVGVFAATVSTSIFLSVVGLAMVILGFAGLKTLIDRG